jgi:hypothetical protein
MGDAVAVAVSGAGASLRVLRCLLFKARSAGSVCNAHAIEERRHTSNIASGPSPSG